MKCVCCRLRKLKAESRGRREQREADAATSLAESRRRRDVIERQFYEWNDGHKVDCALIYTTLLTYAEMYHGALLYSRPLDPADRHRGPLYVIDYMAVCVRLFEYANDYPSLLNSASTLPCYSQCSYTHLKPGPSQWQTANH